MAIGDILRMVRNVSIDGQAHINVIHFLNDAYGGNDQEEALLDAWDTGNASPVANPEARLSSLQTGYTSLVQVGLSAQVISPDEGDIVERAIDTPAVVATDTGQPTFSQIKMRILTDRKDRSGRGGFYVGGIAEADTTGNVVTAGMASREQNLLDLLASKFTPGGATTSGFTIGVWSRLHLEFNPATILQGATILGTMRSRRAGVGI